MKWSPRLFFRPCSWLILLLQGIGLWATAAVGATEKLTSHPALDVFASASRDGRFLAFVSERSGNADIWIKALTMGVFAPPRQVTTHPGKDMAPSLNQNGSQLLYVSYKMDPRGDIYLQDILSGKESRLTDSMSADSWPRWGRDGNSVYYLKKNIEGRKQAVVRRSLQTGNEDSILEDVSSASVGPDGWIVYSDGRKLLAVRESAPGSSLELTTGEFLDLWPSFVDDQTIAFVRYQEDTNGDGAVDTNDQSSIWLGRWDLSGGARLALYQVTPAKEFHLYPSGAVGYLYFSDLKRQDIYRLNLPEFLDEYSTLDEARVLASLQIDRGHTDLALQTLTNISANLVSTLSLEEQAEFDFAFVEMLREVGAYSLAQDVLRRYAVTQGRFATLYEVHLHALQVERHADHMSAPELKRVVQVKTERLIAIGSAHEADPAVKGQALLEAGKLHVLADDPLGALDYLVRIEDVDEKEIQAKALFARGKVYRTLGEDAKLLRVFVDVIQLFGEESSWGKRAAAQAIAVSERGEDVRRDIASLISLANGDHALPFLSASALFRAAELYDAQGEQLQAVETLDRLIRTFPAQREVVAQAYRKKGQILANTQQYQEAAEAYATLVELTGQSRGELQQARRLMVLQLVRSALKKRNLGEVRIAAKELRHVLEKYPDSVEAHRGYIETKVMLKETAEVRALYEELSRSNPDNPVYHYGRGLALTYETPPDLPEVIGILQQAVKAEPGISYFHQTLGWAYEQRERREPGEDGYLEKAEREYRIALELNDGFQFPEVESNLLLNLGNTYMALGNFSEAYRHYKRRDDLRLATREDVTELLYRKNFGEACFKTGRTEESIRHYQDALKLVPADQIELRAELLERIGLSHQDDANFAEAVRFFSEALELNLEYGTTRNLALLRRNIGVNLYNLSVSDTGPDRESLKRALKSYFASLKAIEEFGVKGKKEGEGLVQLEVALGEQGVGAGAGFDRLGEEKLLFSYIASTYEQLSEPDSAKAYYLKKLAFLPQAPSGSKEVAVEAERAVVLNRLGVLSHQLGQKREALDYVRQSLQRTRALGLDYGTTVNLYNVSRIASELQLKGERVDGEFFETLISGLEELIARDRQDRLIVYLLANVAFLLSTMPEPFLEPSATLQETLARYHWVYHAKQKVVPYYKHAVALVEEQKALPSHEAVPVLLLLRLNLMELALQAGKIETYKRLQGQVHSEVEGRHSAHDWIVFLLEAEWTKENATRAKFLQQAFDVLMALPPQAHPRPETRSTVPFYERLSALYTDLLVEQGDHEKAFAVAEQVEMRKIAVRLYEDLGDDVFLARLGDFGGELRSLLQEMREAANEGAGSKLEDLSGQFEELIFAVYEESPWAVSYFMQYPPSEGLLREALSTSLPYVKVVSGNEKLHVFVHDGEAIHYVPLRGSQGPRKLRLPLPRHLAASSSFYLSLPSDLEEAFDLSSSSDKQPTRVSTFYDILNGRNQRSLFHSRVAVAGGFVLKQELPEGETPFSVAVLTGDTERDERVLRGHHILVGAGPVKDYAFIVNKELGVRDTVGFLNLVSRTKHTALLIDLDSVDAADLQALISSLMRTGYPHVVVARGSADEKAAVLFVSSYQRLVATHRVDEAVALAAKAVETQGRNAAAFQLYGYAGMDQEEKAAFADSVYKEAVSDAVALYQEKRFPAALGRIEDALSVIQFTEAQQDFSQLTKLAVDASFKVGNYERAVFHQKKLLGHLGEINDLDAQPEALYRLGILHSRLEEFQPATQNLENAIALWKEREELDRLAEGIATLGVVRENMGAYADALAAFGRSFQLFEEIGEIGDMAAQHRRIGRIYYLRLGGYLRAREHFNTALGSYRNLQDRRAEGELLFEIGLTYEKVGLFDDADGYYVAGRRIGVELQDPFLVGTGELYQANTAWFRGEYQSAFDHLRRASEAAEDTHDPQLTIMIANTKGLMYWTLNEIEKGLLHLKRALGVAERQQIKTEIASSLNNLGLMFREKGDLEASLEYFERARQIDEQLKSRWGLGYDYRNIGISLMKLKRYAAAEEHFLRAEQISSEIGNTTNWVKALLELGNLNRALGKPDKGIEYYDRAYQVANRYGIKEVVWQAAGGKAALLRTQGQNKEAFSWYAQAINVVEGMRAALKIDEFRNSFQANKQDLYEEVISLLVEMGRTEEAFNYLERSRSRSFIDLLGNQKLTLKNQGDEQRLERINTLYARVEALSGELGSSAKPPDALLERYREAKAMYEEAILELKQSHPELSSFVAVDPLTQPQVERMLEPGVGLLSYKVASGNVFIWLVTKRGTTFYQVPAEREDVSETIRRYRALVQRLEPVDEELQKLYDLLITPAERNLLGLSYLGIIPDGALHFLSFAALKSREGYLLDRYPLFYAPSASVLTFTFEKRKKQKRTKVLAIGNPDLGDYNYDLPLAELEARSIRWDFPDMDILTGSRASKEWVIDNISNYGVIHLAAHGEFDEQNPLLSSIWLASENPKNRRLTVKEVFSLEINADLVTLSACQTGLGRLEAGELIGLNRAFIYAGTHALVSALWRVDDLSTSVLMKHFYRNYVAMDKAKSLRKAQLEVKKEFPHPSYWAGLGLVGDYK